MWNKNISRGRRHESYAALHLALLSDIVRAPSTTQKPFTNFWIFDWINLSKNFESNCKHWREKGLRERHIWIRSRLWDCIVRRANDALSQWFRNAFSRILHCGPRKTVATTVLVMDRNIEICRHITWQPFRVWCRYKCWTWALKSSDCDAGTHLRVDEKDVHFSSHPLAQRRERYKGDEKRRGQTSERVIITQFVRNEVNAFQKIYAGKSLSFS